MRFDARPRFQDATVHKSVKRAAHIPVRIPVSLLIVKARHRAYEDGKKIGWNDGVRALWCLLKYTLLEPRLSPKPLVAGTARNLR